MVMATLLGFWEVGLRQKHIRYKVRSRGGRVTRGVAGAAAPSEVGARGSAHDGSLVPSEERADHRQGVDAGLVVAVRHQRRAVAASAAPARPWSRPMAQ